VFLIAEKDQSDPVFSLDTKDYILSQTKTRLTKTNNSLNYRDKNTRAFLIS